VPERRAWDIPSLWLALAILLMVALHLLVPLVRLWSWPWPLAGLSPLRGGIALAIWGERHFHWAGTAVRPFEPSSALVEAGPYRFTRNPMYLGMLLALIGIWLLLGSLGPLLVLPAFFWLIRTRFVLPEEAHLERHFGQRYRDYRCRVRRWL
jgi:protein-S-isoprenylcysteine O-methyltransferase Ste14